MRIAVIRGLCALACALAFHALLLTGAARFGRIAGRVTLPELDLSSVDLSFSDTPDETARPIAAPPPVPVAEPPPSPPPPAESRPAEPPRLDLPPDAHTPTAPPAAEPRPTDLRPTMPTPPETQRSPEPPPMPLHAAAAVPSAPAPSQARITVDKQPAPRHRIKPEYPKGARQRREEGDVTLELDVSADGIVGEVRVVGSCGFPELEQSAIQAVKRTRFTPARRGSSRVPATARLTLTFRLKD